MNKSFLQSDIWGTFREGLGWRAHKVDDVLILERQLPFQKTFLYSPEVITSPDALLSMMPKIQEIAKRRHSIFYRLELAIDQTSDLGEQWEAAFRYVGFLKAFESVQPDDRQIVPLKGDDADILAQMKQKGRYNVRLAERSGVLVRESTPKTLEEDIKVFYSLMQETGTRDRFSIRSLTYFETLTKLLYQHACGKLFIATYKNVPLAAALVTHYDDTIAYLYGASSTRERQAMAPYALHWAIMQWGNATGAEFYDLLAIAPPSSSKRKHTYEGITRFKQQFGGDSVTYLGSWDFVFEPVWYTLFKFAEKTRRNL